MQQQEESEPLILKVRRRLIEARTLYEFRVIMYEYPLYSAAVITGNEEVRTRLGRLESSEEVNKLAEVADWLSTLPSNVWHELNMDKQRMMDFLCSGVEPSGRLQSVPLEKTLPSTAELAAFCHRLLPDVFAQIYVNYFTSFAIAQWAPSNQLADVEQAPLVRSTRWWKTQHYDHSLYSDVDKSFVEVIPLMGEAAAAAEDRHSLSALVRQVAPRVLPATAYCHTTDVIEQILLRQFKAILAMVKSVDKTGIELTTASKYTAVRPDKPRLHRTTESADLVTSQVSVRDAMANLDISLAMLSDSKDESEGLRGPLIYAGLKTRVKTKDMTHIEDRPLVVERSDAVMPLNIEELMTQVAELEKLIAALSTNYESLCNKEEPTFREIAHISSLENLVKRIFPLFKHSMRLAWQNACSVRSHGQLFATDDSCAHALDDVDRTVWHRMITEKVCLLWPLLKSDPALFYLAPTDGTQEGFSGIKSRAKSAVSPPKILPPQSQVILNPGSRCGECGKALVTMYSAKRNTYFCSHRCYNAV